MSESRAPAGGDARLRIFISYRRQDAAPYAGRLYDDLAEHFGDDHVFIDIEAIEVGADFEQVIVETIEGADVLLAVVGPQWVTATDEHGRRRIDVEDDFVRRELEVALNGAVRVIPVLVQDAQMPAADDLPPSVAAFCRRQAMVMSDRRWRAEVAELIRALEGRPASAAVAAETVAGPIPTAARATPPRTRRSGVPAVPHHRTRFVGRVEDMKRVGELLGSTGLVTIVGSGGVGKSRLALEAARALEAGYADGVCLAELAVIDDGSFVVPAVAAATGVEQRGGDLTLDVLVDRLRDRQLLLILDNCEHLIDDAAAAAEALVQHCPALHLLATSREALEVDGEAVLQLAPLPGPSLDREPKAIDITDCPAALLFADRAALASPSFTLDDGTAPAIARIAVALDGLPLALELAAASMRHMALEDVVAGLSGGSATGGARRRTSQARQRTLWDTVDWSYKLLADSERLVLERLGVFAGDFAPSDAEKVCGAGMPPGAVAPAIARLVECSLVDPGAAEDPGGRLRLLYAVREYARSRLASRADDPTPSRLQAWAAEVARVNGREVDVGDERAGLEVLDAEHPNLIAALTYACDTANGVVACEITTSLAPYWDMRGFRAEGVKWVEQALAIAPADDALRAACLLAAGRLLPTADFDGRRQRALAALEAADRAGDDVLASAALASLGHIDLELEQRDSARRHVEAALARARAADDVPGIALATMRLAYCEQGEGDDAKRQRLLQEATDLYEKMGNRRGQLWCLAELGFAHLTTGNLDAAAVAFDAGIELARQLGYRQGESWMLDGLGETAVAGGHFEEARARFEAAQEIQLDLRDELNRGWSLGGLVRAALRSGDLADALHWLDEFNRYLHPEVAPLYEYGCLLLAGRVAMAAGHAEQAARILGALTALEAPASLSPADHDDQRSLQHDVAAALDAATRAAAEETGRGVPPAELVQQLLDACSESPPSSS